MEALRLNVVINVEDFEEEVAFYREALDMPVEIAWNGDDGPGAILRAGDGRTVEFFGPPYGARKDPVPSRGIELSFEVDDADAWHDRLVAMGVPIARGLVDNPWGDRSFGVDDPAGIRIWLLSLI